MIFKADRKIDFIALGRVAIDINCADFSQPFGKCENFRRFVGGSPANTAVGLSRLGCKVGFIGKVSNDSLGEYVTDFLSKQNIDTSRITPCDNGALLGLAFTEIRPDGSTNLMMYRTEAVADLQLKMEDIDESYIASAGCLIVSGSALAASPSREAALLAIEFAVKNNTLVVFDLDYRAQIWKSRSEVSLYYTLAAERSNIIMGSREEFNLMDGMLAPDLNDENTADRWFQKQAEIVIIKHGKEGSHAFAGGYEYNIKPYPVKALKSTGGGDAFASAFLSGLAQDMPMAVCLERATASASIAVCSDNCSAALPDAEQLNTFIENGRKNGVSVITELKRV